MNYFMFSIKDTVTGIYGEPFCQVNKEAGIRSFKNFAGKHPNRDDLQLYLVAEFSNETGEVIPWDPEFLGTYQSFSTVTKVVDNE